MLVMRWSSLALLATGFLVVTVWCLGLPVAAIPRHGHRGSLRRVARLESALWALSEPLVRRVSALCTTIPGRAWRARLETALERADGFMGLTVDEFVAIAALCAIGLSGVTLGACSVAGHSAVLAMPVAVLGFCLPSIQLAETIRTRQKEICRGLPAAIEIIALCMGAGLDFPASIRLVAEPDKRTKNSLKRELRVLLEQLELGSTRREALRTLAERVPIDAVRDFVNAVIQAEEKGSPLARVIQIQGRLLSQRRSVAAEEAAARAGVMMIVPMVLLMGCILTLLMGPFIVRGGGL